MVHSLIPTKHWPPKKETMVLWFFESISPICVNPLRKLTPTEKSTTLKKGQIRSFCVCPNVQNKKSYVYMLYLNYELIWFSMWPPRSSHWLYHIYLIVLLQTSECHFPEASKKSSQKGSANCLGAPNPPCQWIVLPGFQETNDFFGGPEISIYEWLCRWDNQLPFGGKVLHIYVDGDKNQKPHWFLKGKGWKTGKNLMILSPIQIWLQLQPFWKLGFLW